MRGTWIPVNVGLCDTFQQCNSSIVNLIEQDRVNALFVDVWNNGIAYFDSDVIRNFSGFSSIGPDVLQFAIEALKPYPEVELHAWFEYGFMAEYQDCKTEYCKTASKNGWIIGNHGGFVWVDPAKSTRLISNMVAELISKYPRMKTVQLDDHFAYPADFEGSSADIITNSAKFILANNVKGKISFSPATIDFSRSNLNVNWDDWYNSQIGFSMYTPQLYRDAFSSFQHELDVLDQRLSRDIDTLLTIGIKSDSTGTPSDWPDVQKMIKASDSKKFGSVIWYARSMLGQYIQQFEEIWGSEIA
jgi:uncharacterized lipoprotein YddW (UPF0748 family)